MTYVLYSSILWLGLFLVVGLIKGLIQYKTLTPYNFILLCLVVFGLLPHISLFYQFDSYRVSIGVTEKTIILISYFYTLYAIVCFTLLFKGLGVRSVTMATKTTGNTAEIHPLLLFFLAAISSVLFYRYISSLDSIALLVALFDSLEGGKLARSGMVNGFEGSLRWTFLFTKSVMMFLTIVVFLQYISNKNVRSLGVFLFFFIFTTLSLLITSEKGPVIWFFLAIYVSYMMYFGQSKIRYAPLFKVFGVLLFLISLLDYLFMGNSGFEAVSSVASRAGSAGITPAYFYLKFFPAEIDFLHGTSFPNPGGIFPYEPFNLTIEVAKRALPHLSGEDFISTMPAIFWGELYANFGTLGVLVITPFFGGYIYFIFKMASYIHSDYVRIACFVWLMFHFRVITGAGFSEFLLDFDMWLILGLSLLTNYKLRI